MDRYSGYTAIVLQSPVGNSLRDAIYVGSIRRRRSMIKIIACLILSSMIVSATPASTHPVEQFYRGRTLSIIVGFGPGGGYDAYSRVLARHIGRHIPGNPQVIVQNMPGAASLRAVQYLDTTAPKDGTVITAFNSGLITETLINADRIKFRFSNIAWIGSVTRDARVCYAWAATDIRNFADLKNRKQFNMGAAARGTANFMNAAVLKNMLGIPVHLVTGYQGSGEYRIALERGELDGDCGTWDTVPLDWRSSKKVNPIVRFSSVPVPGVDVPFVGEFIDNQNDKSVLDILNAPDALGRPYVASKHIPADRIAALRAAFDAVVMDDRFLAEISKMQLSVFEPTSGLRADAIVEAIYRTSPALITHARAVMAF